MAQIIAMLMENQPGALSRVVGLFSQRGYNIETLNVAPTTDPTISRLTVSTKENARVCNQMCKHLNRLIDVAQAINLSEYGASSCELALIKLQFKDKDREALKSKLEAWRAHFIDTAPNVMIVEFAGSPENISSLVSELNKHKIIEVVRSGIVSIGKDVKAFNP